MAEVSDDQIRVYAYRLWEKAGCPDKDRDDFWHRAKSELVRHVSGDEDLKPMPE